MRSPPHVPFAHKAPHCYSVITCSHYILRVCFFQGRQYYLPQKQVPADAKLGDEIEVFLYKDSKDRIIATTNQPKLTLGGLAVLEVAEIGKIGAFLDWGLEKDLFLPYKEMTKKVQPGDEVLVTLSVKATSGSIIQNSAA